ncbi:hypothetical protein NL108_015398 [Boleophthalmus pectinirostris]|nr:hypothetical protein NL108_015398 [Boleophthalmus pectinirostris]
MASLGPARESHGDEPKTGDRGQRTRGEEPEPGDRAQRTRGPETETAQGDMRTRGPEPELGDRGHRTRGEEPAVPRCAKRSSPVPRSLLEPGWNLSFAGCGFRSVYYFGALSCLLERVPELVHGAAQFSGASSGSLVAAALAVNVPISVMVSELVAMALEARSLTGGVFSPAFSLQRRARDSLLKLLPLDAHVHASRRLCVSLTRMHDGKNLRVTSFRSREELVQVLLCSSDPLFCSLTLSSAPLTLYSASDPLHFSSDLLFCFLTLSSAPLSLSSAPDSLVFSSDPLFCFQILSAAPDPLFCT